MNACDRDARTGEVETEMKKTEKKPPAKDGPRRCVVCKALATLRVGEDPTCEDHVALIYERQIESDARRHLAIPEPLPG